MKKIILILAFPVLFYSCNGSRNSETEAKEDITSQVIDTVEEKGVFFVSPSNGESVNNPVKLNFGVKGMDVEPAGVVNEGKGHHHIVIDGTFIDKGTVVPADSMSIHYGKGQIETELVLSPGIHKLTMQFADGFHQSYGEEWSQTIEITVLDVESAEKE